MKKLLNRIKPILLILFLPVLAFGYFLIKMPYYLFTAKKIIRDIKKDQAEAIKNRLIKDYHKN